MGSAGSACLRLHKLFLEKGIDSTIISLNADKIFDSRIMYLNSKSKTLLTLNTKLEEYQTRKNIKELGTFTYPRLGSNVIKMKEIQNADIIYLHWVLGGFLNFSNFEQIFSLKKPVIIFMHDMWWITGGCHHSFECEKYKVHCYDCQIFKSHNKKDLSYKGFDKKANLYQKFDNLFFVSPSWWLLNCAKESNLTHKKPTYYIPNILDDKVFKSLDKSFCRKILNLPEDQTIICFGAESITSPYKGWIYLKDALQILLNKGLKNISVLIFGGSSSDEIKSTIPFPTYFIGFLKDEFSISLVYNSADVFIAPSLAETFGYVILESLSCGTPVVGFKVGGIPDLIDHKKNGYLANYRDANDLATGIEYCIVNKISGRRLPVFDKNAVMNQHIGLINSALKNYKE
jgi:glycosyltransferase involved in cell wall biosynthesis